MSERADISLREVALRAARDEAKRLAQPAVGLFVLGVALSLLAAFSSVSWLRCYAYSAFFEHLAFASGVLLLCANLAMSGVVIMLAGAIDPSSGAFKLWIFRQFVDEPIRFASLMLASGAWFLSGLLTVLAWNHSWRELGMLTVLLFQMLLLIAMYGGVRVACHTRFLLLLGQFNSRFAGAFFVCLALTLMFWVVADGVPPSPPECTENKAAE